MIFSLFFGIYRSELEIRDILNFAIFVLFQLLLSGCATYKVDTLSYLKIPETSPYREEHSRNQKEALQHPLYRAVPRHRSQLRAYDAGHWIAWALFGNDDEGIFGEGSTRAYKPWKQNTFQKAAQWWMRNPLHNLCHYGIGSAGRMNSELTLLSIDPHRVDLFCYTPAEGRNFGSESSSFFAALHGGKPFISLRLRYRDPYISEFYLGWRENGAFGLKFHPFKKRCSNSFL